MAFDLTGLVDWIEEPGNVEDFFTKAVLESQTMQEVTVMTGIKGETKIPNIAADYDILQDGDGCSISPKGNIDINQRTLNPQNVLVFEEFCPRELEAKFTRQTLPAGSNYDDLGLLEQLILSELARAVNKSIELAVINGEEGGAALNASLNLFDGFFHTVDDEIAAATIPGDQQLSGLVDVANIIATVEAMADALPIDQFFEADSAGRSPYIILMSHQAARNYDRAYRSTFTALPSNTQFEKRFIDGTNIELIGVNGITLASDNMILAKRENLWVAVDVDGEEMDMVVFLDEFKENVRVKARFKMDTQINFPDEIVVNGF